MHVLELVQAIHGIIQNAGKRSNLSVEDMRIVFVWIWVKFAGSWRPFRKYIHTCVLEKLVGFVASWLDFVLCIFIAVCLVVIRHRFYTKNTTLWVVECDKFETYLFAFRRSHNTLRIQETEKKSTLTDYYSFQDLSGKFSHSKAKFSRKFTPGEQM